MNTFLVLYDIQSNIKDKKKHWRLYEDQKMHAAYILMT